MHEIVKKKKINVRWFSCQTPAQAMAMVGDRKGNNIERNPHM